MGITPGIPRGGITLHELGIALAPYLTSAIAADTYVPRSGGTLTGNLVVPEVVIGGVDGPRLNRSGTSIRARNNANNADAPFSAGAITVSGNLNLITAGSTQAFTGDGNISATSRIILRPAGGAWGAGVSIIPAGPQTANIASAFNIQASMAGSSTGPQRVLEIATTYNQSGTASSDDFRIVRTESALGSGEHNFINCIRGTTSQFSVNRFGGFTSAGACIINSGGIPLTINNTGSLEAIRIGDGTAAGRINFVRFGAGGNAAVGYNTSTDTGDFRISSFGGNGSLRFVTGGTSVRVFVSSNGRVMIGTETDDGVNLLQLAGSMSVAGIGSSSAPSISIAETNTGFWRIAANQIGVTLNGTSMFAFTPTTLQMRGSSLTFANGGGSANAVVKSGINNVVQIRSSDDTAFGTCYADQIWLGGSTFSRLGQRGAGGDIASGYNFNITGGTANRDSTGSVNAVWYSTTNIRWYAEGSAAPGVVSPRMTLSSTGLDVNGTLSANQNFSVLSGVVNTRRSISVGDSVARLTLGLTNTEMETGQLTGYSDDGINLFLYPRVNASDGLKGGMRVRTWKSGTTVYHTALDLSRDGNLTLSGYVTSSFQSLSADPSTIDIPAGMSRIVKNTFLNEVRDWVNDGGIMKKSPAYT